MTSSRHEVSLEDVTCLVARGVSPSYINEGGVLVINQKCIRDWKISFSDAKRTSKFSPDKILQVGDILICSTGVGTLGRVAQVESFTEDMTADSHITIVRPIPERIDSRFLGYVLKSSERAIEAMAEGSTGQTELPRLKIKNYVFSIPVSRTEQEKIVKILGDLDRKIELNRQVNETLEQIGQALFKHYFIDNPERENWDNRTLGEFFPIRTGKKDANFSTSDGQYPFFTCSQSILRAPEYSFDGAALLLAGNGDFNIKYYRGKFEAYQRTYVLMPHNEKFLGLLYFLMSIYLAEITGGSRGSVIKFITKGMIEDYVVKLPDDDQLKEVSGQFNQLTIAIEKNRAQTQTLEVMRDSLLPKLMDGSITV